MKKVFLWLLIVSMIAVFSLAGCKAEGASKEEATGEEKPDKELFDKYFSDICLATYSGFFWGHSEENISTFLPHNEVCLRAGFKNKKDFAFRTTVFNLEVNDFVKKGAMTISSEGADGFAIMDGLLLSPGSYEYRIYIEDTLVVVLPFEVISYVDYFKAKLRLS